MKRVLKNLLLFRGSSRAPSSVDPPQQLKYSPVHHRRDIDGLRAVAVCSGISFHFFPSVLPGGFVGVDIFFVISGYLITSYILAELAMDTFSIGTFYARRVKRLLPALCFVLFSVAGLGWATLLAHEYMSLGKQIAAAGAFSSNILLMLETNYFNPISNTIPLLHLWSLGVEEQFYIVWPLIITVSWRSRRALVGMILFLTLASLLYNLECTPRDGVQAFYLPLTRVWELLIGALLAQAHQLPSPPGVKSTPLVPDLSRYLFTIGVALLTLSLAFIKPYDPFPGWRAILPACGTACIIAVRSPCRLHQLLLSNRIMVGIGLISYPLYLWHWPLLSFATILSSGAPSSNVICLLLAATVVLSIVTYYVFEEPIRRGAPSRWKVIVPLCALMIISAFGGAIYAYDGFSHRLAAAPVSPRASLIGLTRSCAELTQQPNYPDDWCNPQVPHTSPSVLLLGDSLSAPSAAMLLELTKSHPFSFRQFARGQCTSLIGYGPLPCRELLDNVLSQDFIKEVQTVIIAIDWRSYVFGKNYIHLKNAPDDTPESFASALQRTLDYWESQGKRIVIFYSPPQGMNIDACVLRRFSLTDPKACRYTLQQAIERDADYRLKLKDIIGQRPKVLYFDPFPYMCSNGTCMVTRGSEYMYVDSVSSATQPPFFWNHLSEYGSRYLANTARDELVRLIAPPPH